MVMYYLVFPDGSKLFQTAYPEDFVYHCLCLAIDKDLGLRPVKVLDTRGLNFFRFAFGAPVSFPLFPCLPFPPSVSLRPGTAPGGFAGGASRDQDPVWYYGVTLSKFPLDYLPVICYYILVKSL